MLILSAVALALAGKPLDEVAVPPAYTTSAGQASVDGAWWQRFEDPALQGLISTGLQANLDLQAAAERIRQADGLYWQARSGLVPSLSLDVSASTQPFDALTFSFGGLPTQGETPDLAWNGGAYLTGQLQVDLFGQSYLASEASRRDVQASEGDLQATQLAVSTRIARAYYDLVAAERQIAVIDDQIAANESLLELTELRYRTGGATGLDVLQQRQQTAATRTALPQVRHARSLARQQLAILLGRSPTTDVGPVAAQFPALEPVPAIGVPAELIDRRPDLRAAALRLEAAHKRVLSEVRSFLPTLQLQGQVGYQANYLDEFDSQDSWSASAALSMPLFLGGRTHGAYRQVKAAEAEAVHSFQQALYSAISQVESALSNEAELRLQVEATRVQVEAARAAYEESRAQYASGLTTYISVLTASTALQQAELNLVTAERNLLGARIALHEALGGGDLPGEAR